MEKSIEASGSSANEFVISTSDATFQVDVVERSQTTPVVVDFWAEWCAPCRALAPVLEKLAAEYGGKFILVKAETDANPEAAMRMGVQGIPAVYAMFQGEAVDFFDGARPPDFIRRWLDGIIGRAELGELEKLERENATLAIEKYRAAATRLPHEATIQIGLARTLASVGNTKEALEIIAQLERRGFLEPEGAQVKAQLELGGAVGDLEGLRASAEQSPRDWAMQLKLAQSLASAGEHAECLERALRIVQGDRQGQGELARQLMVTVFHALPAESDLVATFRKKLALALY